MPESIFNDDNSKYKVPDVVSAIRTWAIDKMLIEELPENIEKDIKSGNVNIHGDIGAEAESILREKGIVFLSYNEAERTINIHTKVNILKKEEKVLPVCIKGCLLKYSKSNIDNIGASVGGPQSAPYKSSSDNDVYFCGSSISLGNEASAGTLGCLVKDENGKLFGLTNNHVSGACSHAQPGMPVVAPGLVDVKAGGLDPFTIGHHARVLEHFVGTGGNVDIWLNSDAAIFSIKNEGKVSSMQGTSYDTPVNVLDPIAGMKVEKVGRTTGFTKGVIDGLVHGPIRVNTHSAVNGFSAGMFFCNVFAVVGTASHFSDGGDSGSLVVHVDDTGNRHAIGLVFAGGAEQKAPGGKISYMLPLRPILERLRVEIVNGHNVAS